VASRRARFGDRKHRRTGSLQRRRAAPPVIDATLQRLQFVAAQRGAEHIGVKTVAQCRCSGQQCGRG